jgi:hypothetical protein
MKAQTVYNVAIHLNYDELYKLHKMIENKLNENLIYEKDLIAKNEIRQYLIKKCFSKFKK